MSETCTCGEPGGEQRHHDTSPNCRRDDHEHCLGDLWSSTGSHWFCACLCHPEPSLGDISTMTTVQAAQAALRTWQKARSALHPDPSEAP